MFTLMLGTGLARIIGIASIPILTRLYTPDDFGVLSLFSVFLTVLGPLLTLRYVVAVPLPRTDTLAFTLFMLCVVLLLAGTGVLGMLFWLFHETWLGLVSGEALIPYWWLIVLGAAAVSGYELMSMWATRRRDYRVVARTQVLQSLSGESVKVALGLAGAQPMGLILGQVVSQSMGGTSMLSRFRTDFQRAGATFRWHRLARAAWLYREYPFFRLPSQLLLVFSLQSPLLFAGFMYGTGVTGQFGLAMMALTLPVNLVGHSMARAYYAETARLTKKKPVEIFRLTLTVQRNLLVFALVPVMVLFWFGEDLFVLVFGQDWRDAGTYASLLSVFLFFRFMFAPLVNIFNVFGLQRVFLGFNIARAVSLFLAYLALYRSGASVNDFVLVFSCVMAVFYLSMSIYVLAFLRMAATRRPAV